MADSVQIGINRIYLKDLSFESPASPQIFREDSRPEIKIDVSVRHQLIEASLYEVTLVITATGVKGGQKSFVVEVEQAGLFTIQGVPSEHMAHVLTVFCPNLLFPYARQAIDSAMNQGSFPSLLLPPFNFESLLKGPPPN